jgi:hypothetical protein
MALAEDMLLDMHVEQGSERAKALLDSNTRKQECVLEVELINGVFQSIYTNPEEVVMVNSPRSLDQKPISAQHNAHTSPLFPGATTCLCRKGS